MRTTETLADKIHLSDKVIEACLTISFVPQVCNLFKREEQKFILPQIPQEIPTDKRASQSPGDIRGYLNSGILTDYYQDRDFVSGTPTRVALLKLMKSQVLAWNLINPLINK